MKTSKMILVISCTLSLSILSACSKGGFSTSTTDPSSSGGSGGSNTTQGTGGGSSTTTNPMDSIDLSGYADGGDAEGALVVSLDKTAMALVVSVPLTLSNLSLTFSASVPKYPDIQIYNYTDSNNISRMAVKVPLKYVIRGVSLGTATSLMPNGETLPYVGGELPSTNLVINASNSSKIYLYIGAGAVAVYISHPAIPEYLSAYFPIRNKTKTQTIGYVGVARKTAVGNGGFVVSTKIPASIAKTIDNYLGSI